MGDWEKFDETSLPEKEDFYSHLNMEDIADADHAHVERVCKASEVKSLGEYHDYSHLNMEDLADADYAHVERVCKASEVKCLGEYHDLYVQIDTLLLADVFENFRNMCREIYEIDPPKFVSAPELAG